MSERQPEGSIEGHRSSALADALLERARPFQPLSPAAHRRVAHRLHLSLSHPTSSRSPWLRPVVVAAVLLFSGTSFGIAFNRLVIRPLRSSQGVAPAVKDDGAGGRARVRKGQGGRRERAPEAMPEGQIPQVPDEADAVDVSATATPMAPAPSAPSAPAASPMPAAPPQAHRLTAPAPAEHAVRTKTLGAAPLPTTEPGPASATSPSPTPVRVFPRASGMSATYKSSPPVRMAFHSPVGANPPQPPVVQTSRNTGGSSLEPPPASSPLPSGPTLAAPASEPTAATEELLLATALRTLRVEHNPASALAALDRYHANHGKGRLAIEATMLRAEALATLGRKSEALQSLDGLDLGKVPGAVTGHLERAELRERAERFADALADFDWALAHAKDKGVIESAMAGRMRCRQRMGDVSGARGDAAEYLRRFPNGPHLREAMTIEGSKQHP